jgi:hypothetical protein
MGPPDIFAHLSAVFGLKIIHKFQKFFNRFQGNCVIEGNADAADRSVSPQTDKSGIETFIEKTVLESL